ncbi:3-ketoacyl-ACP reductase [Mesorhizobium escarrei]|uniref:3-oxoacyl-(Acyl-carrier-protein) reductase FabG n=1 Tax=Mesorhizobium escarrei TaxID=666018 RepID=A0ABN8JTL9_9HYPH|nr:3-ketoacyl-ACP reductase [Mesorhizobium escarrei]CAH2400983.1 putative 3-oxoacyl-(acyl-carrier-protein) reductase FabG [Mesorhizobium escarrei]
MSSVRQAAFITGSSRGIGLATAVELARNGFDIALNGPIEDAELAAAEKAVAAEGAKTVRVPGDVSVTASHAAMLEQAEAAIGPLSTLVNNAGVSVLNRGDLLDVSEDSYDRCMAVNAKAQFFMSQAFARLLVSRTRDDGRFYSLINVSSSNAVAVAVQRGEYCTSKAAAAMIAKVFAVRLGSEGIAVYDIQPGVIETDMTRVARDMYQKRISEQGLTLFPRLGDPSEIGRIIATLATGGLPYTTGHVISADAGMLVSRF